MKHNQENIKALLLKHGFDGNIDHLLQDVKGTTWIVSQVIEKCVRAVIIHIHSFGPTKATIGMLSDSLGLPVGNDFVCDIENHIDESFSFIINNESDVMELCSHIAIKYFTLDDE